MHNSVSIMAALPRWVFIMLLMTTKFTFVKWDDVLLFKQGSASCGVCIKSYVQFLDYEEYFCSRQLVPILSNDGINWNNAWSLTWSHCIPSECATRISFIHLSNMLTTLLPVEFNLLMKTTWIYLCASIPQHSLSPPMAMFQKSKAPFAHWNRYA